MVLQYFGSEKDIFGFDRGPKTFVFATLILMIILRLMAVLLEYSGRLAGLLSRKKPVQGRQHSPGASQGELGSDGLDVLKANFADQAGVEMVQP
jgi:hypothetical protein